MENNATSPVTAAPAAPMTKTPTAPIAKAPTAPMMPPVMPQVMPPMMTLPAVQEPAPVAPTKPMEMPEIKHFCKSHMHRYVLVHTKDGFCCDGFVEHIDDEVVCIAVIHGGGMDPRAFLPGFGYPPLYPYPYFPRRRFYRQVFPLAALLGLSLLPYYY
ncbi:hypothetical protein [Paenibacillus methanolicus]|uniref:Uncharacterized protein n=1 Tax=Paenibacillus methanolicus TaxID=582686 RepID=A0A5S5CFB1_9BACL|nr:hypothetical protein BCM02_102591 [Paenibacillus methanolicus]